MLSYLRIAAPLAVAIFLSGCGGSKEQSKASNTDPSAAIAKSALGAVVGATTGLGVSTGDLPDFAELPPGAKAIHNMVVNHDDKVGGSLSLETSQSLEEVVKFYKTSIAKHQLKIIFETASADGMMLNAQAEDQKKMLQLVLGKSEDGKTHINIVHTRPKG